MLPLEALALATGATVKMPASALDKAPGKALAALHVSGVCIDTRASAAQTPRGGAHGIQASLYVALVGENFDGHAFVAAAIAQGAAAVMLDAAHAATGTGLSVPCLVVPETTPALGAMARWFVQQAAYQAKPRLAITGSNGKTTTKEMLSSILRAARAPVHQTVGNLNNAIGVPLTLLSWPAAAWAAVLEMGMNAAGEIRTLTEMAQPHVGVITGVALAHLGGRGLGSLARIAQAKCELFAALPPHGIAVLNLDDAPLQPAAQEALAGAQRRVIGFGRQAHAEVQWEVLQPAVSTAMQPDIGMRLRLRLGSTACEAQLPCVGLHNASNAAAAAAAAYAVGVSAAAIAQGLAQLRLPPGRLQVLQLGNPLLHVIDDTYNANPASMQAALQVLQQLGAPPASCWAVLGDMLELGATASALHRTLGEAVAAAGITQLFALGSHASTLAAAAQHGGVTAQAFSQLAALQAALQTALQAWQHSAVPTPLWILVKASRGLRLERVVAGLQAWLTPRGQC